MRLVRFLKDWTLPVSIGLGIIIYFVFAEIPELEPVCEWFLPLSRPILPSFMFLILFTVFCKVDFKKLRPVKWQDVYKRQASYHLWSDYSLAQAVCAQSIS